MWLDLSVTGCYREHIVVHEFGHILGLEHEHQRSDFWRKIKPYMNIHKMKNHLGEKYKDYKPSKGSVASSQYDPGSVMHYW